MDSDIAEINAASDVPSKLSVVKLTGTVSYICTVDFQFFGNQQSSLYACVKIEKERQIEIER